MRSILLALVLVAPSMSFANREDVLKENLKVQCLDELHNFEFGPHKKIHHFHQMVSVKTNGKTYAWDGQNISIMNVKSIMRDSHPYYGQYEAGKATKTVWSRERSNPGRSGKVDPETSTVELDKALDMIISKSFSTYVTALHLNLGYAKIRRDNMSAAKIINLCGRLTGPHVFISDRRGRSNQGRYMTAREYKAMILATRPELLVEPSAPKSILRNTRAADQSVAAK